MKNRIFVILFIITVVAMFSVQIYAKQQKTIQSVETNKTSPGKNIEVKQAGTDVSKSNNKFATRIEKPKRNIKMSDMLKAENQPEDNVTLEKTGKTFNVVLKKGSETKQQAHIKLKDLSGDEIADITADYGQLTDSEKMRIQKGEAVLRSIRSLRLESKENDVSVTDTKGNKHRMKAKIDVNLNSMNDDSALDITADNELNDNIKSKFDDVAKNNKMKLSNRGGVLKVEKTALKNGQEVQNATVSFKVEPEWLGEENMNNVKILRFDEETGNSQVLSTEFAGIDDEGMLEFNGISPNGLSTFAIFMTENLTQTSDTKFDWGSLKAFILPLMLIITIGAAYVGSVVRREN